MIILLHSGAATVSPKVKEIKLMAMKSGVMAAYDCLVKGGSSVDAVQVAVNHMENDPIFNAGYGSSLTDEGLVEMDAIIMDGSNLKAGSVAGVSRIANPVTLARAVMDKTDHCLLISAGAEKFAQEIGMPLVESSTMVHGWALQRLNQFRTFNNTINQDKEQVYTNGSAVMVKDDKSKVKDIKDHDTVGAVAIDASGHVAVATSTGGITAKKFGRVGDSPIIGAGGWADDESGAVSTTGHGEAIMRVCLAREIMYQFKSHPDMPLQKCVDAALEMMKNRIDGYGGAIAVSKDGQIGIGFTTGLMPWVYMDSKDCNNGKKVMHYGANHGEHFLVNPEIPLIKFQ